MTLLNQPSHELMPLPAQASGLRQLRASELNEKAHKHGFY